MVKDIVKIWDRLSERRANSTSLSDTNVMCSMLERNRSEVEKDHDNGNSGREKVDEKPHFHSRQLQRRHLPIER